MGEFFAGYRDPLFGLLIFFALIFIISFFSYWWTVYKSGKSEESIEGFLKRFEANSDKKLSKMLNSPDEASLFLADIYTRKGEYEKAISLLLKMRQGRGKKDLLILKKVADVYLKAGFLQRSKGVYEEVLKYTPRDSEALEKLIIIYEKLEDFKGALEVADSLGVLKDVSHLKNYLQTRLAIKRGDVKELKRLGASRLQLEALFRLDSEAAWKKVEEGLVLEIVDILWNLRKDEIKTHLPLLKELYSAKGYVSLAKKSSLFEFDLLINYKNADLEFEYICKGCKKVFPFYFPRCPACYGIDGMKVNMLITKRRSVEEGFSV